MKTILKVVGSILGLYVLGCAAIYFIANRSKSKINPSKLEQWCIRTVVATEK